MMSLPVSRMLVMGIKIHLSDSFIFSLFTKTIRSDSFNNHNTPSGGEQSRVMSTNVLMDV